MKVFAKMTEKDLERLRAVSMTAALIVQGYRPEGMHAIEWMAICEEYRYFAMIGTHCLCELARRHKAKTSGKALV